MFTHLHLHSEYSILDGLVRVDKLFERAKDMGFKSVAITDHGNVDCYVKALKASQETGVNYIPGVELYIADNCERVKLQTRGYRHAILLAKNKKGFSQILKIMGECNKWFYYKPIIDLEKLAKYDFTDIIMSSACVVGLLSRYEDEQAMKVVKNILFNITDNFYMEIMPHNFDEQRRINTLAYKVADKFGLKLLATNDAHYLRADMEKSHEVLLAINTNKKMSDPNRMRFSDGVYDLCGSKAFKAAFDKQNLFESFVYEEAISNTQGVVDQIDFKSFGKYDASINVDGYDDEKFLSIIKKRFHRMGLDKKRIYRERLRREIDLVFGKKFGSYFYIEYDAVRWAKHNDIMIGVGRGSAGGSLLSYVLGITGVDPLKFDLRFERFIAEDRIDLPDIDLDIEDTKRDLLIRYVTDKYGEACVSNISTFGSMNPKGVITNVTRVCEVEYDEATVSKSIDEYRDIETITGQVKEGNTVLKRFLKEHKEEKPYFFDLEGVIRNAGVHAAGVVIGNTDINSSGRGYLVKRRNKYVLNWDKDDAEYMGWIKFDFLGLKTLSVLSEARRLVMERKGIDIDFLKIPLDDERVLKLFGDADTCGVFQYANYHMRQLLQSTSIDKFADLYILTALYRPGTIRAGVVDEYIATKNREKDAEYFDSKAYKKITELTHGFIVFQEQMTDVLQAVGFTYAEADAVRKICSKKKGIEELEKYEGRFVKMASDRFKFGKSQAKKMFDCIKTFGKYAFNQAHSVEYAMTGYWTAYMKRYYYDEFMSALMTFGDDMKIPEYRADLEQHDVEIMGQSIRKSKGVRWVVRRGKCYPPFCAIKGIGDKVAAEIERARDIDPDIETIGELQSNGVRRLLNVHIMEILVEKGILKEAKKKVNLF